MAREKKLKEKKLFSPVNSELKGPCERCMKKARVSSACSRGVVAEGRSIM